MRDAIVVEGCGRPAVLLITDGLCSIAAETAAVLGRAEFPILTLEPSLFGLSRTGIAEAALPLGPGIIAALTEADGRPGGPA